jgi:hypothetical protein
MPYKLPLEGEEITRELIARQTLPENASDELIACAKDFETIYRFLPEIAKELADYYKKFDEMNGGNPGAVVLLMGGGRLKGKPLSLDSDIDLFLGIENIMESIEGPLNADNALHALQVYHKQEIRKYAHQLCKKYGVKNKFHILGYDGEIPDTLEVKEDLIPIGIAQ